ncbi:MAG: type III-B CRISPR module RAMP protein Cmr4 [Planctomycetaceae bacterium]|nr:type III-B CRISPR module RAMP protein Cmr4 [Planctomycetaceae bacterium]
MPNTRVYWLHALSPTHVGVGRGVGYIDLPIDREAITDWPVIRGSAFKGVWADRYKADDENRKNNPELKAAFGLSSDKDNNANSGSLIPTDARLVCLPVRSFRGTFAWCTSSLALRMLHRTLNLAGATNLPGVPDAVPEAFGNNPGQAHVTAITLLIEDSRVCLEDLDLVAVEKPLVVAWAKWIAEHVFPGDAAWQGEFEKRFVVLPDTVFDFLTETGTEVNTRVRIDNDTKTVVDGALWTEESVPAETIFAGVVACDRVYPKTTGVTETGLLTKFASEPLTLQIGGKATVGRGQMRCVFTNPNGGAK